jgi:hypothetical protein
MAMVVVQAAVLSASIITWRVILPMTATSVIVAGFELSGRDPFQAGQPQASGEQSRPQSHNVTPCPRLLRIRTDHILH